MSRKSLSDRGIAVLKPRAARYALPDPELRGHYVRVQPSGAKSFVAVARDPSGKQVWTTLGSVDAMLIDEARALAREAIKRVRSGLPAFEAKGETFANVADAWIKRHVQAKGLRTRYEITRLLAVHVLPAWGAREFVSIRRSDVAALLDRVEDDHGARQADTVLTVVRSLMRWHATRRDDYNPPIVGGMARQSPHAQQRSRILTDDEIRAVWQAAAGTYGGIVKLALLTGQRREKVVSMRWDDVPDGEWSIPAEAREKGTGGVLALPQMALDVIAAQPRFASNPHVFAGRGAGAYSALSKGKAQLDAASVVCGWRFHDLRRTARSLMSRAGVRPDIAERVMGHAIAGVEGIYDRHSYRDEKADALRRLAAIIDGIVHPRENVLPMTATKRRKR